MCQRWCVTKFDKVVLDGVRETVCERWWLTKMVEKDGLWEMVDGV